MLNNDENTLVSKNSSCSNDNSTATIKIFRNNRFQSHDYPNFKQMNCAYRLKTKSDYIKYRSDISRNNSKIRFICGNDHQGLRFYE